MERVIIDEEKVNRDRSSSGEEAIASLDDNGLSTDRKAERARPSGDRRAEPSREADRKALVRAEWDRRMRAVTTYTLVRPIPPLGKGFGHPRCE